MIHRIRSQLARLRDVLPGGFARTSFAQEGEDLILERVFERQSHGIYVDVGAHHPRRFSNTYLLYRRGWRGVNIDAAPGSMRAFHVVRPRDLNLEVGVAREAGERDFFVFNEPALSTFDAERARSLNRPPYEIVSVRKVRCAPLATILHEHAIAAIDLLSIDAEGYDYDVVRTLDWDRARPRVVVVEQHAADLGTLVAAPVHGYMTERGYGLFAKTFNSVFYSRPIGDDAAVISPRAH
jgi:FkbM family methyltransferase